MPQELTKFDFEQWIQLVKLAINSEVAWLNNKKQYDLQVKSNLGSLKSMKTTLYQAMKDSDFAAMAIRHEMKIVLDKIDGVANQFEKAQTNKEKGTQIPTSIAMLVLEACQAFEGDELDGKRLVEFLMVGGELRKWINQTHGELVFKVPDFGIDVESEFRPIRALHRNLKDRFSKSSGE